MSDSNSQAILGLILSNTTDPTEASILADQLGPNAKHRTV
jgi:hypothetical protein